MDEKASKVAEEKEVRKEPKMPKNAAEPTSSDKGAFKAAAGPKDTTDV